MKRQLSKSEFTQYEEGSDKPAKEYDHALDALRYLVFKLDAKRLARKKWFWQKDRNGDGGEMSANDDGEKKKVEREWLTCGMRRCGEGFVKD